MVEIKCLRRFNHTAHKQLWDWLAHNPGKAKEDWPGWWSEYSPVSYSCFACATASIGLSCIKYDRFCIACRCSRCPLVWGVEGETCLDEEDGTPVGLFKRWERLLEDYLSDKLLDDEIPDVLLKLSVLAEQIRDLPLRPDRPEDPFITEVI